MALRRLAPLLLLLVPLVVAVPAAAQAQIDAAVRALRSDPVYVAPGAELAPTPAQRDRIEAAIARADTPVFVAILPAAARREAGGSASELDRRIGTGVHEPGTYAVVAGDQFRAASTVLPRGRAAALATEAFRAHAGGGLTAVIVDFVDRVGREARSAGAGSDGRGNGGGNGGTAALIILGVLAGGGGLFAVARGRRRRREIAEQVADLRRAARDDLVALGDDVRAIDVDVEMPGVDPAAREDLSTALARYDQAERALDSARRPEDFGPITQALEEGRFAMESAKARLEGRTPPERRPPCFFDPRHGPSTRDVMWAPDGGPPRPVPACEADALRVEEGRDPRTREIVAGGRAMPYYDAPAYFGPWAGGFYGGFGLGGFLPGLLFGSTLAGGGLFGGLAGGAPDQPGDFGGGDFGGGGGDFGGGDFGGGDFGGGGGGDF